MSDKHPFDNPYDEEEPARAGESFWRSRLMSTPGTTGTITYSMLDAALENARQHEANIRYARGQQWIRWAVGNATDG